MFINTYTFTVYHPYVYVMISLATARCFISTEEICQSELAKYWYWGAGT